MLNYVTTHTHVYTHTHTHIGSPNLAKVYLTQNTLKNAGLELQNFKIVVLIPAFTNYRI